MIKTLLACMAALVSHFSLANDTVLLGCWQTTYQVEFFADGRTPLHQPCKTERGILQDLESALTDTLRVFNSRLKTCCNCIFIIGFIGTQPYV